jgi:hypothetical protein
MRKTTKLRNINIIPSSLVPVEIRIEVYKEAMKIIKRGEPAHGLHFLELCLLLPCILWNLKHYCDDSPSGLMWYIEETPNMFPELTRNRLNRIISIAWDKMGIHIKEKNKMRIIVLREMIKEIEQRNEK